MKRKSENEINVVKGRMAKHYHGILDVVTWCDISCVPCLKSKSYLCIASVSLN